MRRFDLADFSGDTRYAQAVGRVRVLETRLLSKRQCMHMVEAGRWEDVVSELRGTDYAHPMAHVQTPEHLDRALSEVTDQRRRLAEALDPAAGLVALMADWGGFISAKEAVRRTLPAPASGPAGTGHASATTPPGAAASQDVHPLPRGLVDVSRQAADDFERHRSSFRTDMLVEQASVEALREVVEKLRVPYLLWFIRQWIDLANVYAILRWRQWVNGGRNGDARGRIDVRLLPRGGFLRPDTLASLAAASPERLATKLQHTGYAALLRDAVAHHDATGDWWLFEKRADEFLTAFARLTRYTAFGPEPVFAYLWFAQQEAKNVRLAAAAWLTGLSAAVVSPRLREGYYG